MMPGRSEDVAGVHDRHLFSDLRDNSGRRMMSIRKEVRSAKD
jgi:hypothetical protein